MSLAGLPSRRHPRSYFRGARRRRRATPLSRFAPEVLPLEGRCLLASSLLGTESLVNATAADNQRFSTDSDRTMDVTGAGTVITVWATTDAKGSRIVAQRTGADGAPLGARSRSARSAAAAAATPSSRPPRTAGSSSPGSAEAIPRTAAARGSSRGSSPRTGRP